jgi:hypothetical protein
MFERPPDHETDVIDHERLAEIVKAPALMASTAVFSDPYAVNRITRMSAVRSRMADNRASPSIPGM